MISLTQALPLIQSGSCVFADYDESWLEFVLAEAAQESSTHLPYLSDIAKAVISSLREEGELRAMPLEFFFARLRTALEDLGLTRLAAHVVTQTPAVVISLDQIAQQEPIPLFFYAELNKRISRLQKAGVNRYLFSGLRPCCLILEQRHRLCKATERSRQELEDFLKLSRSVYAYRYICTA